jgi:hypothetical protein
MAAGDLITGDWQAELRTTLMGGASDYTIVEFDITPAVIVSNDLPKLLADGEFQGAQFRGPVLVTLTMNVTGTSQADLLGNIDALATAWRPASSNLTFVVRVPQLGKRSVEGRPIEFEVPPFSSETLPSLTVFGVRAQFKAGDPTWTQL